MTKEKLLQELHAITEKQELDNYFQEYLWKWGKITTEFKNLKSLTPEEKKQKGAELKEMKNEVEDAYQKKLRSIEIALTNEQLIREDPIDISLDAPQWYDAHVNLLAKERRHVEDVAKWLWMTVEYGHDIVSKYENFYSVNIPADHPATEMHDTIYLKQKNEKGENFVLRTHTTAHDVQYIKKYGTPLSLLTLGKVYRYEKLDASHDTAFWQIDWLVIDKGMWIAHFKSFMTQFLSALFEEEKHIRLRPAYFPFVEPGFEIDVNYNIGSKEWDDNRLELLGAWMIHPHVLREGGLDPEVYSGFAFGIGLTRLVAIKHGLKDVRLLTNGDLRFVKSF